MRIFLLGVFVLYAITVPAVGQTCLGLQPSGGTIEVTQGRTGQFQIPVAAFSETSQRYLVTFAEAKGSPDFNDLYGQMLNADGERVGGISAIVEQEASQAEQTVTWNDVNNEFLVAWESQGPLQYSSDARRIDVNGAPLAAVFQIARSGNELLLAFGASTYLFTQRGAGIEGQLLSAAVASVGNLFGISGVGSAAPNGALAFDGNNARFLSVWRDQSGMARNIQARIIRPDGSFATNPFVVSTEFPFLVRAAFDSTLRRYLVVYNDSQNYMLRGRFVDENGGLQDAPFPIIDEPIGYFEMAYVSRTGFYVLVGAAGNDIVAFAIGGDGRTGTDRVILATRNASRPGLALNAGAGECLALWAAPQGNGPNNRIRARRLVFGRPMCLPTFGCGSGLCGIGICGGGFAPMMPITLAGLAWMKRRRPGSRARAAS